MKFQGKLSLSLLFRLKLVLTSHNRTPNFDPDNTLGATHKGRGDSEDISENNTNEKTVV